MKLLEMNGRDLSKLPIINYELGLETLDGEGTGRSRAMYWPLVRDPQGSILNAYLEIATVNSKNPDFRFLWQTCKSMGKTEFVSTSLIDPVGDIITQNMYIVMPRIKFIRIRLDNGEVYTDSIRFNLIAEMGF